MHQTFLINEKKTSLTYYFVKVTIGIQDILPCFCVHLLWKMLHDAHSKIFFRNYLKSYFLI